MKKSLVVFAIVAGSTLLSNHSQACTIIAAGKKATVDGSVLLSHTDTGEDSRFHVVAGKTFAPGTQAPIFGEIQDSTKALTDDGEILGYLPQVAQTFTYIQSAYSHINEYQLAIAESTTEQREGLAVTRKTGKQIMTIEQAMIFALQRYKKAREAVQFIGELVTTYGFLPSAEGSETLVVGDTEEAWLLEVFGVGPGWTPKSKKPGAIWTARRIGDDQALVVANWSVIREIDPKDTANFMVSANYIQAAIDRGYYDPASGKPFIWQEAYAPIPGEYAVNRHWLFYQTFAPNLKEWPHRFLEGDPYKGMNQYFQEVEGLSYYPFSAKPEKKISVQDVMAFQRSTFEGTIYDLTSGPQWLVPERDKDEKTTGRYVKSPLTNPFPTSQWKDLLKLTNRRPVARHRGHYGMICQLRGWLPREIGGVYWVFLDNAYFSPYVPIYAGNISIAKSYSTYNPKKYEEGSARWAIDFVDNLSTLLFQEAIKDVHAVRDPFEKKMLDGQAKIEKTALELYKKDPQSARAYLTRYTNGLMSEVLDMFLNLRDLLITKYTNNRE